MSASGFGVDGLVVRFGPVSAPVTALEGVSLDAPEGQVTCVIGGDGAGKSTLLRVLAGAIPAERGRIRSPGPAGIGFLPAGSGVYLDLSVEENLEFSARAYGLDRGSHQDRQADLLARTGLTPFAGRPAGVLSGGMRQKLGVVRAMLHRPRLLILDEPTTGVDPVSRADVWWLVTRAAAEGAAVVVSTTYVEEAQRASQILLLGSGRPLAAGTTEDILASIPGRVRQAECRPDGPAGLRSWRRGSRWRVWEPDGTDAPDEPGAYRPDLRDAVTVAELRAERWRTG
ncbi:MAG TPA: ABC transporter ATP-binding protein [Acidimicrobiales bacterium]|nr:ABC transporter ATP-binding protein [Acidimicrobiales bacterium]